MIMHCTPHPPTVLDVWQEDELGEDEFLGLVVSLEEQEAPVVFALKEDDSLDREEDDRKEE